MALFSALAIAATVASVASGAYGMYASYKGQKVAQEGQERAEKIREVQMNLEAQREKRKSVRQAIIARSAALSSATSQNAAESSGAQGGMGNIVTSGGDQIRSISHGQQLGAGIFAANRQIAQGQSMMSTGQAFQGLGNFIGGSFGDLSRLFQPRIA